MGKTSKSGTRPLVTKGLGQLNREFFVKFRQRSGKAVKAGATAADSPQVARWKKGGGGRNGQKSLAVDACMYGAWCAAGCEGCVKWYDAERKQGRENAWKKRK